MNIKDLRRLSGLNQSEFAAKIGRSKNTIVNWEAGNTSPTKADIDLINQLFGHLAQENVPRGVPDNVLEHPLVKSFVQQIETLNKLVDNLEREIERLRAENK